MPLLAAVILAVLATALLGVAAPGAYDPASPPATAAGLAAASPDSGLAEELRAASAHAEDVRRRNAALRAQIRKERARTRARIKRVRARADRRVARAAAASLAGVDAEKAVRLAAIAYDLPQERMLRIARCESTLIPSAASGPYLGLFQFGAPLWRATPYAAWRRDDPQAAALAAAWAFARGMDRHWPVCGRL